MTDLLQFDIETKFYTEKQISHEHTHDMCLSFEHEGFKNFSLVMPLVNQVFGEITP